MARAVKEQAYAERRKEILDVAQKLVYTKGYERMSIQDVLDELKISKGAFYHYFDSKQALLEALVESMMDMVTTILDPIVQDPQLPALAKLQRYFDTAARWKSARKPMMLELMRIWYDDHNAIVRNKAMTAAIQRVSPLLVEIIRQGVQEGVMTTPFPDQAGEMVFSIFQSLGDAFFVPLLLRHEPDYADAQRMESTIAAYTDALERILGTPKGSLQLIDPDTLKEWIVVPQHPNGSTEPKGLGDL